MFRFYLNLRGVRICILTEFSHFQTNYFRRCWWDPVTSCRDWGQLHLCWLSASGLYRTWFLRWWPDRLLEVELLPLLHLLGGMVRKQWHRPLRARSTLAFLQSLRKKPWEEGRGRGKRQCRLLWRRPPLSTTRRKDPSPLPKLGTCC